MPACDGQTDGRTDGRTDGQTDRRTDVKPIAITCFSIADARKNAGPENGEPKMQELTGPVTWKMKGHGVSEKGP